ncbi:MAG: 3-hydroxyacyl-CoA dehydrogenase/enoyl-CoA hydratase family protein [Labilithrix sp.]|nr:3-hydroxyacyl-CoA dehydrogenase/enoyl-CoA hydratase family protein [Labilithrix sp.]MCW5812755.1 3-hydroxyacyl-CoA dehydrogenase/enoyl-CoA hydratase family protein [Labilithrix sp.]
MQKPIRRTAVIGAGVMGSGIAAHFANAGLEVLLLDIVPPNLSDADKKNPAKRNGFAAGGLEKALKAKPAAFYHKDAARLITVGNTEDDFDKLKDVDLVIEAIIEKMDAKQALLARLEKVVPEHCIVASNTSGLQIAEMTKSSSANLKKHFVVLHFFNPVRYMKLLEIVPGPETDPEVLAHVERFAQDTLGKGVVFGKDTPNFIGNRIGTHAMMATIHQMLADGLAPEDVDNITGTPMGHPKSASFRTGDLVGLDTFVHVADNCYTSLTKDEDREVFKMPDYVKTMVERKLLGDKTKGGFYKRMPDKSIMTFDPKTLEYRPKAGDEGIKATTKTLAKVEDVKERVKKLVADQGKAGDFARKVLYRSLAYSARRIGEISDSVAAVDDAMKWGYAWELGPFETWDALGLKETAEAIEKAGHKLPESVHKMIANGVTSWYQDGKEASLAKGNYVERKQDPRYVTLPKARRGDKPVLKNDGAEAWDLGDGVLGLTFKTKANSIDPDVIQMIGKAVAEAETNYRALLVANEGDHFCVGANLLLVVMSASQQQWEPIKEMVKGYQYATQKMKYARVPVVAAPYGMTLGGGLELCMGAGHVQAAAETYSGLVEVGVGLIPGGAGTMNMLWRALEGIPEGTNVSTYEYVTQTFKNIALAKVATSAEEAKALGYFRKTDGVSFDRARQVYEAKKRAIGLAESGYHPPTPKAYRLPGESGIATLGMMVDTLVAGGYASEHDAKIARKLAHVLCGGIGGATREVTEDEILELEREAFVSLCGEPKSLERMQYMLMNNKPLRN